MTKIFTPLSNLSPKKLKTNNFLLILLSKSTFTFTKYLFPLVEIVCGTKKFKWKRELVSWKWKAFWWNWPQLLLEWKYFWRLIAVTGVSGTLLRSLWIGLGKSGQVKSAGNSRRYFHMALSYSIVLKSAVDPLYYTSTSQK